MILFSLLTSIFPIKLSILFFFLSKASDLLVSRRKLSIHTAGIYIVNLSSSSLRITEMAAISELLKRNQ